MSELAVPDPGFPTTPWLAKLAALDVDAPPMKPLIASIVERHVVIDPTTVSLSTTTHLFFPAEGKLRGSAKSSLRGGIGVRRLKYLRMQTPDLPRNLPFLHDT